MAMEQQAEQPREFVDELKPGTKLLQGQYTIVKFLNAGGFGITYLAKNSLEREVVIKECFPGSFCRRTHGFVAARSRAHENEFAQIVRLFVQEAKSLSRLIHPNIVGVHQVFEDNQTAYMAIDYIEGRDLLDIIERDRALLKPPVIAMMLKKLLGAVAFIHDNGMLHRDISPDNILISRAGDPVLIDFGAARQQATRIGGKALSALRVVKDGYSPQEFYISGTQQGPSSDLYALAASFYHLISGEAPPNSQTRLVAMAESGSDPYQPLAGRFQGYPENFLEAIDEAVSVLPKDRIQSAREWLDRIAARPELKVVPLPGRERPAPQAEASPDPGAPAAEPAAHAPRRSWGGIFAILLGTAAIAGAAGYYLLGGGSDPAPPAPGASAALAPALAAPAPEASAVLAPALAAPAPEAAAPDSAPEPPTEAAAQVEEPAPVEEPARAPVAEPAPVAPQAAPAPLAPQAAPQAAAAEAAPGAAVPEAALQAVAPEAAPQAAAPEAAPRAVTAGQPAPAPEPAAEPAAEPAPASAAPEGLTVGARTPMPEGAERARATETVAAPQPEPESLPAAAASAAPEATAVAAAPAAEAIAAPEPEAAAVPEPQPQAEPAPVPESLAVAPGADAAARGPAAPPAAEIPAPAVAEAMLAEAQALTDDGVALRQVENARWSLELPFEAAPGDDPNSADGAFPVISGVIAGDDQPPENAWIREGVLIYAVNGTFVSDQAAILSLLMGAAEFGVDHFLYAPVRIKTEPSAEQVDVTLAARARLSVDLVNGVSFRTEGRDGRWQTEITAVARPEENGLQVGDVVLGELLSGEDLTSSRTLEFAVNRLARAHRPFAVLAVERNGQSAVARMTLARGE